MFALAGCNVLVRYNSDPPGATLTRNVSVVTNAAVDYGVPYPQTDEYINGGCMNVDTPRAQWPDGAQLASYQIQLCKSAAQGQSFIWRHTLKHPGIPTSNNRANLAPSSNQLVNNSGASIDEAKKKCADLGFKMGTEGFGNCVLKLSK
jgi:hypothetical protein